MSNKPAGKKVNIIGAGIAGLSVGCYLQKNGFRTQIFEKHSIPGGLCTSWQIGDYTFDGCAHWILGTGPGSAFYKMWSELIDMQQLKTVNHEYRILLEVREHANKYGNKSFYLYNDLDRLRNYLLDLAPEDEGPVAELIGLVKALQQFDLPPVDYDDGWWRRLKRKMGRVRYLGLLRLFLKYRGQTNYTFAEKLKNPFLKECFRLLYDDDEVDLMVIAVPMAAYDLRSAGYPVGGSLAFARRLEEAYLDLGGKVHYKTPVLKIDTIGRNARSITVRNNVIHEADYIISAGDWHHTIFDLLEGKYATPGQCRLGNLEVLQPFFSSIQCSFGIGKDLSHLPHFTRFPLDRPVVSPDGSVYHRFEIHNYSYDPTLAPSGKTCVVINFYSKNADFWIAQRKSNRADYRALKQRFLEECAAIAAQKMGLEESDFEIMDISTPATFHRYTGNWKGSTQGWLAGKNLLAASPVRLQVEGLNNVFLCSHWNQPGGGLPVALKTGRDLAMLLCRIDGIRFRT